MAELLSFVPAIIGGVSSLFGSSNTPSVPTLPGQSEAAQSLLDTNANLTNIPGELLPLYQALTQNLLNNPYAAQAQQGANDASTIGMNTANTAAGNSSVLSGLANSLAPYLTQVANTAFDPQQELYNRTLEQVQQQQRVAQAARGIAMSPYGAGLEGDATRNFNIDWQNNQLDRQASGASTLAQLLQSIGSGFTTAGGLGEAASSLMGSSAALPYSTYLGMGNDINDILNNLGLAGSNANLVPQQQITNWNNYLNTANAANNTAINAANQSFGQNQTLGKGLGTSLSTLFGTPGSGNSFFSTLANGFGATA